MESKSSLKSLIAGIATFLWLGILAGGYFWAHKPFEMGVATAVAQTILNIVAWLALTWLATCLGLHLLARLRLAETEAAPKLVMAGGMGLGLLAIVVSLLGFVGLFKVWAAWLLVVGLAGVTLAQWRRPFSLLRQIQWPRPQRNFQWLILAFGAVTLFFTFIMSLTPVIAWDALTYHLVGPKFYIEAGRFVHPVNIPQLGFPLLGQMHFTLGMLLVGDGVAPLFHFGYGLLTLALTILLAREAFGWEAAWLAALVLLSVPTFFTLMSWPYVDVTLMFYTTAVAYAFYRWWQKKETGWIVVLGMMVGFSGGLKYTAVATPIAIALILAWVSRRDGWLIILQRLLLTGSVALLLVLPWLLENYITTGNPVYPFFFDNGLYWDDWWAWWYDMPGTGLAATAPWRLLTAPLEATIAGTEGSDFYEATIGPFILGALVLLPLVWGKLARREREMAALLLLLFAVNYLLWLNGLARTALLLRARFLFLIFGVTAVLSGFVLAKLRQLKHPALDIGWLVQTVLSLTITLLLVNHALTFLQANPLPVIVGLEEKERYVQRQIGVYDAVIRDGVNQLSPESSVVMLWETRTYACAITCHPDPILGRWLHLTQHLGYDAPHIRQQWQAEGITHVLVYEGGLQFLLDAADSNPLGASIRAADLATLTELTTHELQVVQQWPGAYTLYGWK